MRGFKAMRKVPAHPHLAYYLRGHVGLRDLRELI